jgi:hypothetical protein
MMESNPNPPRRPVENPNFVDPPLSLQQVRWLCTKASIIRYLGWEDHMALVGGIVSFASTGRSIASTATRAARKVMILIHL